MCGIAGIINKKEKQGFSNQVSLFEDATRLMAQRGPDNFGRTVMDGIALFHYRLSIMDLDQRSNQPFISSDSRITAIYNGELYNFKEVKNTYSIETKTNSDTEVVVESFRLKQTAIFPEWNGIFAASFFDREKHSITLVRDRFGVKPLYYYENQDYFIFASEAKVLYQFLETLELNSQALVEYMWFGNPVSGKSMVEGVKKLAPGNYLEYDLRSHSTKVCSFWDIGGTQPFSGSLADAADQTKNLLEKSVRRQLVSDVDVGVFLSGGIDSSAITAFASKHYSGRISTYSVEFDYSTQASNELEKARYVANTFGTDHHEIKVEAKNISQVVEHLAYIHDEPFADAANIPLYLLTSKLKGQISVVLQGDGGDEFFGGYRRYNLMDNYIYWKLAFRLGSLLPFPANTKSRIQRMNDALSHDQPAVMFGLLNNLETTKRDPLMALNRDFQNSMLRGDPFKRYREVDSKFRNESMVQRLLYSDTKILLPNTYLEKVDKSTMANSIEVRVPFLDNDLTEFALSLPAHYKVRKGQKKYLLRQSLRGVVPDQILDGPKKGFGVPYEKWLATDLYELAQDSLRNSTVKEIIDTRFMGRLLEEHKKNMGRNGFLLWKVMILALWINKYEKKIKL
ncbi:MAG: asparagine synthase (glutamine-hydrolyzing) [Algoriphagus sp.]|jgi:asparagine synthase (glutamine-hydrolysing)